MLELKKIDKYYNPGTVNEMCLFDGFDLTVATESLYRLWEVTGIQEKPRC